MIRILALLLSLPFAIGAHAAPIDNRDGFWSEWSDATFARAAREKKFVIMSLQSWWCRWCHVMNQETWANAEVRGILKDKFIPVYVDQDSRPDISQRYERWGWPATIIFAPDGTEIVKLRGFYSPQFFNPILTATIEDPSPGQIPRSRRRRARAHARDRLTDAQRDEILGFIDQAWDDQNGGWSKSKFVDRPMLVWALQRARQGDAKNEARIRKVLTLMAVDHDRQGHRRHEPGQPEAGLVGTGAGISDVRAGGRADRLFAGLEDIRRSRLPAGRRSHLRLPEKHHGRARRRLLRLDRHERGRARRRQAAIRARDRTGDRGAAGLLRRNRRGRSTRPCNRAARWALANRAMPGGGFRHAERTRAGLISPTMSRWRRRCWRCTARPASANG